MGVAAVVLVLLARHSFAQVRLCVFLYIYIIQGIIHTCLYTTGL